MKKAADLQDIIQRAQSTIGSGAHDAGASIKSWFANIDPEAKKALLHGLVGAGLGGAAAGGMAAATPSDPDEKHHIAGPAALGAILGGTAGVGIPYGLKLMQGGAKLPGMNDRKPFGASVLDQTMAPFTTHPGATAGLGAGLWGAMGSTAGKPNMSLAMDFIRKTPGYAKPTGDRLAQILTMAKNYGKAGVRGLDPFVKAEKRLHLGGAKALYGIPLAVGGGMIADKLLQGEY